MTVAGSGRWSIACQPRSGTTAYRGESIRRRGRERALDTNDGRGRPEAFRRTDDLMEERFGPGFKEVYFRRGASSGWTVGYWQDVIEPYTELGWRFMVEEPWSAEHNRMRAATNHDAKEHRLFFMTYYNS